MPDPPGRVVLHFGPCPWEKCQGLLRPLATKQGRIVLVCDEDDAMWLHPSDLGTDRLFSRESALGRAFKSEPVSDRSKSGPDGERHR